jgi:ribosomal-protein-alanine N-acetyltransferase
MNQLETERLIIEPLTGAHAPSLYQVFKDDAVYNYIPQLPPDNVQSLQDRYQKLENPESPDGKEFWLNWAIQLNNEPVYIGRFEATVIKAEKMAYVAYLLGVDFWNQGYATEACKAVLQELKDKFGIKLVKVILDQRNKASIRVLEKCGFHLISTQENAEFFKGSWSTEQTFEKQL